MGNVIRCCCPEDRNDSDDYPYGSAQGGASESTPLLRDQDGASGGGSNVGINSLGRSTAGSDQVRKKSDSILAGC